MIPKVWTYQLGGVKGKVRGLAALTFLVAGRVFSRSVLHAGAKWTSAISKAEAHSKIRPTVIVCKQVLPAVVRCRDNPRVLVN